MATKRSKQSATHQRGVRTFDSTLTLPASKEKARSALPDNPAQPETYRYASSSDWDQRNSSHNRAAICTSPKPRISLLTRLLTDGPKA